MKQYRMKPIKAIQLADDMSNWREVCIFMNPDDTYPDDTEIPYFLDVYTMYGYDQANPGEWICIYPNEELQVISNDIFIKFFEEIEQI